jgi:hypothetical protein
MKKENRYENATCHTDEYIFCHSVIIKLEKQFISYGELFGLEIFQTYYNIFGLGFYEFYCPLEIKFFTNNNNFNEKKWKFSYETMPLEFPYKLIVKNNFYFKNQSDCTLAKLLT